MCRSALGTRAGTRAGTWAGTWAAVACGRQRARAASGQCARLDCDMQHRRRRDLRARQAPSRASSFCRASRCKLSPWRPVTPNGAPPKGRHRRRRHRCLPRSWSFSSCGRGSVLFPAGGWLVPASRILTMLIMPAASMAAPVMLGGGRFSRVPSQTCNPLTMPNTYDTAAGRRYRGSAPHESHDCARYQSARAVESCASL